MSAFLRRWVAWTVCGEVVGFLAPAVVGVLTARSAAPLVLPALVAAGAVEGLLLGAAQAHVLVGEVPALDTRRFAGLTALAASVAYLVGMLPSTAGTALARAPRVVLVLAAACGGLVLLASIGTAQWFELRRHLPRAWSWVLTTAAAWLAGLAVFMLVATPLWRPGQPVGLAVLIGLGAALGMAAVMALVTGRAAERLVGGGRHTASHDVLDRGALG